MTSPGVQRATAQLHGQSRTVYEGPYVRVSEPTNRKHHPAQYGPHMPWPDAKREIYPVRSLTAVGKRKHTSVGEPRGGPAMT